MLKHNNLRQLLFLSFLSVYQCPTTDGYNIEPSTATTCTQCAAEGGSWQANACEDPGCPIMDIGCCQTTECCVTSGCRAPNENYWISYGIDPVPCTTCCESFSSDQCLLRYYDPDVDDNGASSDETYNANRIMATCPTNVEDCAPCATCTKYDEEELIKLKDESGYGTCNKKICEDEKNINYIMNPCESDPEGCGCWCQNVNRGLLDCPHLEDTFWNTTTSSSSSSPSSSSALASDSQTCTACVSGGYSWQVGTCEEEYCPIQDVGCCTTAECCDDYDTSGYRPCDFKYIISFVLILGILW